MNARPAKVLAALLFTACASQAYASNLVLNGQFSSVNANNMPTSWTFTAAPSGSDFYVDTTNRNGLGNSAAFGATGTQDDTLSQAINTTTGDSYRISFDLTTYYTSNNFSASFGGVTGYTETNAVMTDNLISFLAVANSSSTLLSFAGLNVPSFNYLQDVSVTQVSATPLPASGLLMLSALALVGGLALRRR
jgi:hypothetical protein